MAAYTGGVKTVFIPKDNLADLDEVDDIVKQNIRFVPVSYVSEIIDSALVNENKAVSHSWPVSPELLNGKPTAALRQ